MSGRHNYTNPAFCQQSEFYSSPSIKKQQQFKQQLPNPSEPNKKSQLCLDSSSLSINNGFHDRAKISKVGVHRIQRSVSTRSFNTPTISLNHKVNAINRSQILSNLKTTPPKPGPKPISTTNLNGSINLINNFEASVRSESGHYALVPVEELPNTNIVNRYAFVSSSSSTSNQTAPLSIKETNSTRYAKSQENINRYVHVPIKHEPNLFHEETDTFTSLPTTFTEEQPKLKAAFSSDFGSSKSFVLINQKNNQKYAVVPTEDDEDLVDDTQEIIQMHNGKIHRYAIIPTEEEEDEEDETCLSNLDLNQTYPKVRETIQLQPLDCSTPQKKPLKQQQQRQQQHQQQILRNQQLTVHTNHSYPNTLMKNPEATRKLHELLSTPRKSNKTNINKIDANRNSKRYSSTQKIYVNENQTNINYVRTHELTPQRLQYDEQEQSQYHQQELQRKSNKQNQSKLCNGEARTTAIIIPRVAEASNNFVNDDDDENSCTKSSWNTPYSQKVANATATLGVISLMLILGSIINTGLCLYLIANNGRTFYLEFALTAAFAGIGLGILGFRSRHCEWLPNRSFISGYILVTVFCLLKCCALLVLLALDPFPGIPLHDVTTGIVLGLSTFEIFFIGLGVLGSWWCHRPPPDNRINVY